MKVLLVILIALGVKAIYDARDITKKYFAIVGTIVSIISGIILCNVM